MNTEHTFEDYAAPSDRHLEDVRVDSFIAKAAATPTPEPWVVEHDPDDTEEGGVFICATNKQGGSETVAYLEPRINVLTDARLIATCPGLLGACKGALQWIESMHFEYETIERPYDLEAALEAAIAKATQP